MSQFKLIDGVVYKAVETTEVKNQIDNLYLKAKPYIDGITESKRCIHQYEDQIAGYEAQLSQLMAIENIDPEIARMVDPEKAALLGFQSLT